jgi:hypothetical protein
MGILLWAGEMVVEGVGTATGRETGTTSSRLICCSGVTEMTENGW